MADPVFRRARSLLALALLGLGGCAGVGLGPAGTDPFRLSGLGSSGDPAHDASMQLVLDGLDADVAANPDLALVLYERSLQVDPTNAYAYLAIARHRVDGPDPESAFVFLDRAEILLESQGSLSPGAQAHLAGLRGAAHLASGRRAEGLSHLERARELAPRTWSDGRLDARELR